MKRKIFTFVAALTIASATILPAAAAEQSSSGQSGCFGAGQLCCSDAEARCCFPVSQPGCTDSFLCIKPGCICEIFCPQLPEQDDTITGPEIPDTDATPETPDTEIEPEVPEIDLSAMSQLEQAACALINEQREAYGLEPLTISSDLSVKARIKSRDMKENNYFSHNSPTYGSPFNLMKSLGISYRSAAENIAMGYQTAAAVVNAWMNSPGHRANILSTVYESMGIGHVDGYWTQWFIKE